MACYKHFWTTTLIYETSTFCIRTLAFDYLKNDLGCIPSGIMSGVLAQALAMPFFTMSLKGQLGNRNSAIDLTYKPSFAILARGGLLGFCHLSVL